jgi:hypothetical protein
MPMTAPTSADIRSWSKLDFTDPDVGYPAPAQGQTDPLDFVTAQANAYVTFVTARPLDQTMPDLLVPIAQGAVLRRAEQLIEVAGPDQIDTAADIDMVQAFTAGTYSETRRDTTARPNGPVTLNPWPELDRALWLLLSDTPDEATAAAGGAVSQVAQRRDYWRWMCGLAPNLPAWETVEVDWSRGLDYMQSSISPYEPWSRYFALDLRLKV